MSDSLHASAALKIRIFFLCVRWSGWPEEPVWMSEMGFHSQTKQLPEFFILHRR